jgi:hypothetical protein
MEAQTITNAINYERLREFETKLQGVESLLVEMYPDDFKGQKTLEKKVRKALQTVWDMRRDYDVKKLMENKKVQI